MVRIHPDPPRSRSRSHESGEASREASGAVAQLGERLLCKQEVVGSIPSSSTSQVAIGSSGQSKQAYRLRTTAFSSGVWAVSRQSQS